MGAFLWPVGAKSEKCSIFRGRIWTLGGKKLPPQKSSAFTRLGIQRRLWFCYQTWPNSIRWWLSYGFCIMPQSCWAPKIRIISWQNMIRLSHRFPKKSLSGPQKESTQVPQRAPFGQLFWTHKTCLWHSVLAFWLPKITNFLASLPFFIVTLLVSSFLGRYSLLYHELLWDVLFPRCLYFKVHVLHIFRMCVEHLPNFLRTFLYV